MLETINDLYTHDIAASFLAKGLSSYSLVATSARLNLCVMIFGRKARCFQERRIHWTLMKSIGSLRSRMRGTENIRPLLALPPVEGMILATDMVKNHQCRPNLAIESVSSVPVMTNSVAARQVAGELERSVLSR